MSGKIILSTFNRDGKYFAVGLYEDTGKIVKISLPKNSEVEAVEDITSSFPEYEIIQGSQEAAEEIYVIFSGKRCEYEIKKLELRSGQEFPIESEFMKKVLLETCKIPYGKVESYKSLGEKLGTRAYRAVGTALARNPYPLVIPCHRVVKSDRSTGKYGGGSEMKKELLKKEGVEIKGDKVV